MLIKNNANKEKFLVIFFISIAICSVLLLFFIFKYESDMEKKCVSVPLCNKYYEETGKYYMNSKEFKDWLSRKQKDNLIDDIYK